MISFNKLQKEKTPENANSRVSLYQKIIKLKVLVFNSH